MVLVEHFHYNAGVGERIKGVETNVKTIQKDIKCFKRTSEDVIQIRTKVDLFWGALESQLPGMLLKGNPIPSDSRVAILLTKFKDNEIQEKELAELVDLIDVEIHNPDHSPGEVLAMVLMNATLRSKSMSSLGVESHGSNSVKL